MKKAVLFFFTLLVVLNTNSQDFNQQRYSNKVFEKADTVKEVQYATAPWLNNLIGISDLAAYNIHEGESTTESRPLLMDIFSPNSDTVSKRPAIIFVHGGAFLLGSRHNEDMIALCDSFAKMGYVTASIQYRLGVGAKVTKAFDVITKVEIEEDNFSRSVYRGVQDGRAAVRYLKENAAIYNIDPELIYMVGSSAGGFVSIHNIYMDKSSEIPLAASATPDLGGLDEIGTPSEKSRATAIVPFWAAIQSTILIENDPTPTFFVHGTTDEMVPFKAGKPLDKLFPTNPLLSATIPITYGSYCIDTALNNKGINNETYFVENEGHEFYGVSNGDFTNGGPNKYWDTVFYKTSSFLFNQHKPLADYTYSQNNLTVSFNSKSENGFYHKWLFGDGTSSLENNPSHTYTTDGEYKVLLTVLNQHQAWDTISKVITVANGISSHTVTFTVKSGDSLIEGALINLTGYGEEVSNSEGIAIFTGILSEENIKYTVSASGYKTKTDSITITNEDLNEFVELEKASYKVKFVVKADGVPFNGASVTLNSYGTLNTNTEGICIFNEVLPSDSIYYEVNATGFNKTTGKIIVSDGDVVQNINLSTSKFSVKFIVTLGIEPIENAEIDFTGYGILKTDSNGEAVFTEVSPGYGITYKVTTNSYSPYESALNVIDKDVIENVVFSIPSYTVMFTVKKEDKSIEGANVKLNGYGEKKTDINGIARFLNVEYGTSTTYAITAQWMDDYTGTLQIYNDTSITIQMTDIDENINKSLNIWPNPSNQKINIEIPEKGTLQILSANGTIIYREEQNYGIFLYDISHLKPGLFFIQHTSKSKTINRKFIVN